jgi:hypothetical protein
MNERASTSGNEDAMRVVSYPLIEVGVVKVFYEGSYEECCDYMRKHGGRDPGAKYDLLYASGRRSSWVL